MFLQKSGKSFIMVSLCLVFLNCCGVGKSGKQSVTLTPTPTPHMLNAITPTTACTGSSPSWTSTPADLAACVAGASSGDTINVSSGSVTFTTPTTITNRTLTINGGVGGGTTTLNSTGSGSNSPGIFDVILDDSHTFIMGGFTLTSTNSQGFGMIRIRGTGTAHNAAQFRLHNFTVTGAKGFQFMILGIYGLIDSNTFTGWTIAPMFLDASQCTAYSTHPSGEVSCGNNWSVTNAVGLGTVNAVYIENNTFTQTSAIPASSGFLENWDGSRVVVRYNILQNTWVSTHGYGDTSVTDPYNDRGPVKVEFYNNRADCNPTLPGTDNDHVYCGSLLTIRGGTGVIFNNYITDSGTQHSWNWWDLVFTYYALFETATAANHTGCTQDENGNACVYNACAISTSHSYRSRCTTYPCTDQPGYVNKTLLPYYIWNNTGDAVTKGITVQQVTASPFDGQNCSSTPSVINDGGSDCTTYSSVTNVTACFIQANREYYFTADSSGAKAGYTAYTCPHPLAGSGTCNSSKAGTAGYNQ